MELKWIQIPLFLTALLHFTDANPQTVSVGDDVTLSCENVIRNQPTCSSTTWIFSVSSNSASVELVTLGQIGVNAGSTSVRLRVTANCSLLIKKVTEEDVGRYTCQQYLNDEKQEPDAVVYLSLLQITEIQNGDDRVTLRCSVRTYQHYKPRVKWLFEGKEVVKHHRSTRTLHRICYTDMTFETNQVIFKSRFNSLQCEMSVNNNRQLFPFRPQPSGEDNNHDESKATISKTSTPTETETSETPTSEPLPTANKTSEPGLTPKSKDASDEKGWSWSFLTFGLLMPLLVILLINKRRKRKKDKENERSKKDKTTLNQTGTQSAEEPSRETIGSNSTVVPGNESESRFSSLDPQLQLGH